MKKKATKAAKQSMTIEQVFWPNGCMSIADIPLPMIFEHCTILILSPKQKLVLLSLCPQTFTQLFSDMQYSDITKPQPKLPTTMMMMRQVQNPRNKNMTEKDRKTSHPIVPIMKRYRYLYRPMYLLQSAPKPDPMKSRPTLRGPTHSLSFCADIWLTIPRFALDIAVKSIPKMETYMTLIKYFLILFYNIKLIIAPKNISSGKRSNTDNKSLCGKKKCRHFFYEGVFCDILLYYKLRFYVSKGKIIYFCWLKFFY